MKIEESEGHISFNNGYEYFWSADSAGKKIVVKAAISNPVDPVIKQRIGARFEGTDSWFNRFGNSLLTSSSSFSENQPPS